MVGTWPGGILWIKNTGTGGIITQEIRLVETANSSSFQCNCMVYWLLRSLSVGLTQVRLHLLALFKNSKCPIVSNIMWCSQHPENSQKSPGNYEGWEPWWCIHHWSIHHSPNFTPFLPSIPAIFVQTMHFHYNDNNITMWGGHLLLGNRWLPVP